MIKRTLLLIPIVFCTFGTALADDWPQWRGPERTGVSKETGLLPSWPAGGPKLLWTFRDAGVGFSSMSVVGDQLYSMGEQGGKQWVYAVDLKSQKKLWSIEVDPSYRDGYANGPSSTPAIDGGFVYAMSRQGNLVCVEVASGRKVWSQALKTSLGGKSAQYGFSESPLVDGNQVVVTPCGKLGAIAAFDKKTGTLKWSTALAHPAEANNSSLIAIESGGVRQYVQNITSDVPNAPLVIGVRASDGKLLWECIGAGRGMPAGTGRGTIGAINTPIYQNDCVYISNGPGCELIKLLHPVGQFKVEQPSSDDKLANYYSGVELLYSKREIAAYFGGVLLVNGHVYGYSEKEKYGLVCQNFKTGKVAWIKRADPASVVCADGMLYCYSYSGVVTLIEANPTAYREKGQFSLPEEPGRARGPTWPHPVVANGKLYLRDQDLIYCYDVRH